LASFFFKKSILFRFRAAIPKQSPEFSVSFSTDDDPEEELELEIKRFEMIFDFFTFDFGLMFSSSSLLEDFRFC
jgi:hypothetical protein